MDILIVDRDDAAADALRTVLEARGHHVVHENVRKTATERLAVEHFDVIFIDPAPLPSVREFTLPLRWERREDYFYLILTGHDIGEHDVAKSGMNDSVAKPFQQAEIERVLNNAQRLIDFMHQLRFGQAILTDSHIFGQRGFYQLILSALDRAYRYHEQAYLLVIRLNNIQDIIAQAGENMAAEILNGLGEFLSKLHRLSDFLGHTETNEYMLLILRPSVDSEPQDAIERFETALRDFQEQIALRIKPSFDLELWSLPAAEKIIKKN